MKDEIAEILCTCEEQGLAPPYVYSDEPKTPASIFDSQGPRVAIDAEGAEVFVVSDLHLAAGRGSDGRYDGCENFFYDASFRRFLTRLHENLQARRALLIINGDFIDFLRVTYVPGREKGLTGWQKFLKRIHVRTRWRRIHALTDDEKPTFHKPFTEWQELLERIGIHRSLDDLIASISDREEIYGLKTHDYKSVLRLFVVTRGHMEFFDALAEWLGRGHRIIIVKGNHDLEWYWRAVRNYMRLDLAERVAQQQSVNHGPNLSESLINVVLPNLRFIDHAMIIDQDFYVEHGHPYDPLTRGIGYDTLEGREELNIPFGSFFNRYLLNFLEMDFPYLDNVRPTKNILPLMLRNRFLLGLRLLVDHLTVIARTVPKQYISYVFGQHIVWRVLIILIAVIVPPLILIDHERRNPHTLFMMAVEWLAWLGLTYVLIQWLAYFQLSEPDSLAKFARYQFDQNPGYRLITFGHTHNPDQFERKGRWFYNTGTWIPIVETTTADMREDRTFTYLHLERDATGGLKPGVLRRWDDEADRTDPMVLIRGVTS